MRICFDPCPMCCVLHIFWWNLVPLFQPGVMVFISTRYRYFPRIYFKFSVYGEIIPFFLSGGALFVLLHQQAPCWMLPQCATVIMTANPASTFALCCRLSSLGCHRMGKGDARLQMHEKLQEKCATLSPAEACCEILLSYFVVISFCHIFCHNYFHIYFAFLYIANLFQWAQ